MINVSTLPQMGDPTANRPYGQFVDVSAPGLQDGVPARSDWLSDCMYALIAVMHKVGITPDGNEEGTVASQFADAIVNNVRRLNTALDENTTLEELLNDRDIFCSPTADRTMDITNGSSRQGTELTIYNNSATYKVTVTYFTGTIFDVLPSGFVKFKWNGVRWVLIDSSEMKKEIFRGLNANYTALKFENHTDLYFTPTADRTVNLTAGARFVGCEVLLSNDATATHKLVVSFGGVETIDIHYGCQVKFTYTANGWIYEVLSDYERTTETICKGRHRGYQKYKKVIDFGALPNNTTKNVAHGISDPKYICDFNMFAFNGDQHINLYRWESTGVVATVFMPGANISVTTVGNPSTYTKSHAVIEYIKATL